MSDYLDDFISEREKGKRSIIDDLFSDYVTKKEETKKIPMEDLVSHAGTFVEKADEVIIQHLLKDINSSFEVDQKLDLENVNGNYQVLLTDATVENPFVISTDLVKIIKKHTTKYQTRLEKSRAIYDWMHKNITYKKPTWTGYRNSEEVLREKEGICGEMAYLYITMARCVGIPAKLALVDIDNRGKKVYHGCAVVYIDNKEILVDPAYHQFDIKHKKWKAISDKQAMVNYIAWRHSKTR